MDIDALNGKTVTRETLLRYTLKSHSVNDLIRGSLWKTLGRLITWQILSIYTPWRGSTVASLFSHAVAALSIGACFYRPGTPRRVWTIGMLCSVIPDVDVVGFRFGIRYGDFWGHRGFTHSLGFAALLAGAIVALGFREATPGLNHLSLWAYFFLATASHGLLDAMTDGGLGIAFFSPFDNHRYFLPWTPIRVSPIGAGRFLSDRGVAVLQSELVWIWMPAVLFAAGVWFIRRRCTPDEA